MLMAYVATADEATTSKPNRIFQAEFMARVPLLIMHVKVAK
jgi:hypothetical protein